MSAQICANVYSSEGAVCNRQELPAVFSAPVRADLINHIHTNMAKNARQPYAVSPNSGYQHSAESWGTGRALARIPRIKGSGTSRSGQGAFGNMCRDGGMYAPTKTYRRWHRKISKAEKRYAVASALACSAMSSLVQARGHKVSQVKEFPLVVETQALEGLKKTKEAVSLLKKLGCEKELKRIIETRTLRTGNSRLRHGKRRVRVGPLIVYSGKTDNMLAFRNIPGVDICHVSRLNLIKLAPGGVPGRFVIFSEEAMKQLNDVYASKKDFVIPSGLMTNPDVARIINSQEVQEVLRPAKEGALPKVENKNPLKNEKARETLAVAKL
uniref:Large ribosomal subunit protein uL4 n=1 Tax=Dermatophagoides pteronyssinus TaxID=6956 RepID=A0A6P6XQ05_DERPT|nr:60S ribosomal protein L4-B-like [Dermatophagoides pteronyssinus]